MMTLPKDPTPTEIRQMIDESSCGDMFEPDDPPLTDAELNKLWELVAAGWKDRMELFVLENNVFAETSMISPKIADIFTEFMEDRLFQEEALCRDIRKLALSHCKDERRYGLAEDESRDIFRRHDLDWLDDSPFSASVKLIGRLIDRWKASLPGDWPKEIQIFFEADEGDKYSRPWFVDAGDERYDFPTFKEARKKASEIYDDYQAALHEVPGCNCHGAGECIACRNSSKNTRCGR